MASWPPGLYPTGRGGNVPRTMSPAHHDLISSSAQYLSTFTCTSLSSGYLTSSGTAHGSRPIFGPFIPIIAPRKSTLPLLRKKEISIFGNHTSYAYVTFSCINVFSTRKGHTPDTSAFGMLQHLIHIASYSPRSMVWWRSSRKGHTPDASASGMLQHLIHIASYFPRSMVWWKSYDGEIFMGITFPFTFLTLI